MANTIEKSKHLTIYVTLIITLVLSFIIYFNILNTFFIHVFVEVIVSVIGICTFIIVCNTYEICDNNYFTFIGIAYGFIAIITIMQITPYKVNPIAIGYLTNTCLKVFVFGGYIESISLLIAFRYLKKELNIKSILFIYSCIIIGGILLLKFNFIANCINLNGGFTMNFCIKQVILYILNISILIKFLEHKKFFANAMLKLMIGFMIFKMLSNICFTIFYTILPNIYFLNIIAHIFKMIEYILLYKAIVYNVLKDPINVLFNNLKTKNDRLNRQNFKLEFAKAKEEKTKKGYKTLLEVIPEGIMVMKGLEIEYVNKGMLKLLEICNEDMLIGKDINNLIKDDGKSRLYRKIEELQNKNEFVFLEEEFIRKDNSKVDIEISSVSIELNNEKYTLYLIRDITARKRAEKIEKILEIEKLRDKIKTEFFTNVSHELKTPINIIYSTLQLNEVYIKKKDITSINKYNNIMKKNCFRLIRLTNNLIDMTEIHEGVLTPKFEIHNIVNIVENTTLAVCSYIKDKNIEIIFDTEIEEKYILCDPELIERIMLNLLSNSVKYGKDNTVIKVNIYDNRESILISVKDNGIGISKDKQSIIFDAFVQGDKSLNRNTEGSGIGLTIAKSLAELHGGSISFISIEGEGSEFMITLPISESMEEACADLEEDTIDSNILNKVYVEFSDIYF